ncbi:MAG: hypothetical protein AAB352_00160 [Patescibacteria group bacterium]
MEELLRQTAIQEEAELNRQGGWKAMLDWYDLFGDLDKLAVKMGVPLEDLAAYTFLTRYVKRAAEIGSRKLEPELREAAKKLGIADDQFDEYFQRELEKYMKTEEFFENTDPDFIGE